MFVDLSVDNHIHTSLCNHATGTMEQYVLAAIEKGLDEICFLEHMEEGICSPRVTWLSDDDFKAYFEEGERLKRLYEDKLLIRIGVEVGYNPSAEERILERLSHSPWDRIGVSYHFHRSNRHPDHLNLVSKSDQKVQCLEADEAEEILLAYYQMLKQAVDILPGTMVCHIDAGLRYHPLRETFDLPWRAVEPLLQAIKLKNMAIEINTSGLAIRGEAYPCKAILDRAIALNIPLVASSDAHQPEQIGRYFHLIEKSITL